MRLQQKSGATRISIPISCRRQWWKRKKRKTWNSISSVKRLGWMEWFVMLDEYLELMRDFPSIVHYLGWFYNAPQGTNLFKLEVSELHEKNTCFLKTKTIKGQLCAKKSPAWFLCLTFFAKTQGCTAICFFLRIEHDIFLIDIHGLLLLMAEILHQLRLVVYPIIYRVSAPSQVVVWDGISEPINSTGSNYSRSLDMISPSQRHKASVRVSSDGNSPSYMAIVRIP